jgi:hypothetical protein
VFSDEACRPTGTGCRAFGTGETARFVLSPWRGDRVISVSEAAVATKKQSFSSAPQEFLCQAALFTYQSTITRKPNGGNHRVIERNAVTFSKGWKTSCCGCTAAASTTTGSLRTVLHFIGSLCWRHDRASRGKVRARRFSPLRCYLRNLRTQVVRPGAPIVGSQRVCGPGPPL